MMDLLKPLKVHEPNSFVIEPLKNKDVASILKEGCELLESFNIKYWLSAGTLLGLHRDQKPIDHDTDIDIEIEYSSQIPLFLEACPFKLIRTMKKGPYYMQLAFISESNIIFDIYVYYPIRASYINWNDHGIMFYPKSLIEPLSSISFDHKEYASPNPDSYCQFRYGADWKTPRSNKDSWVNDANHLIKKDEIIKQLKFYKTTYW